MGELSFEELILDFYYKEGKENSVVYEDAQDGYDYKKGRYSLLSFDLKGRENEVIIQSHKDGKYDTLYSKYKINFIGLPFKIKSIEIDNETVVFNFELEHCLTIDKEFNLLHIIGY